jgi:alpha-tubulin suppressor-like RCC1 family protein
MAAIKTDGTLWAWGRNLDGELGDNTSVNKSSPVQIGVLTNWSQVSAGNAQTTAVKTDGTLWTWGNATDGRLGNNTNTVNKSSPIQVGALTNWSQVSTGSAFTVSVKADGTLWAWGRNGDGQLGDGTVILRSSPVQVGALTTWSQASAGSISIASAVKTDGSLWSWGNNSNGDLGDGTVVKRSSPVQIGALLSWSQVSAGGYGSLAILQGSSN